MSRTFSPRVLALSFAAVAFFSGAPSGLAAEPAHLEPAEGGVDFLIQGEYAGENGGAQVVALGNGKFRCVGWAGGLPGTNAEVEKKLEGDAQLEGNKAVFQIEGWTGSIQDGVLKATSAQGESHTLKRVVRESPTLGAKPPAGAVVLFDGKNADEWTGGRMDERGFLHCGTKSKQKFGSMQLHVEFRTPFMPTARGQGRGNSGVYLQDRYECQVLDSFGLKGENNETGGIYSVSKPRLNLCYPPLSWQTYDIDFEAPVYDAEGNKTKNAVLTVRLNGVLVQDKVEVPRATAAAGLKEGPEPGPIQLQNHGNPVFFRNIWLVEKK